MELAEHTGSLPSPVLTYPVSPSAALRPHLCSICPGSVILPVQSSGEVLCDAVKGIGSERALNWLVGTWVFGFPLKYFIISSKHTRPFWWKQLAGRWPSLLYGVSVGVSASGNALASSRRCQGSGSSRERPNTGARLPRPCGLSLVCF